MKTKKIAFMDTNFCISNSSKKHSQFYMLEILIYHSNLNFLALEVGVAISL
jgi:hypothetical protein